jgi:hypothetical protein
MQNAESAVEAWTEFKKLIAEEWNTNVPLANAGRERARGVLSALDEIEPLVNEAFETMKRGKGNELI